LAEDDLLRPTLSGSGKTPELYNSSGFFLASFFAGPVAAGVYGLANSYRLGRLNRDLPVIVPLVAACFWLLLFASRHGGLAGLAGLLDDRPGRAIQIAIRALGLGCFATIYLLHRQHYRAAQVTGAASLPGWGPGIVAVIAGLAANAGMISLLTGHH
jgi:hypothetical protein